MYGPPGTGKTLLARACAAQTDATFLKLAGPQLVQMFIGDGAKLVRDCFALAKEKAPAIIFIDELDAVGTKRFDSEKSGDREVQRTMLELLNQLDGFASDDRIKVIAATNRVDVLDPALLRSGRLDRKIEFPLPNEEARAQILKIHSRKMKVDPAVNWGELARSTDEFGGAMLKAVCVEAGMIALRMGKNKIGHEHYVDAIAEVQAKKKDVSVPFRLQWGDSRDADYHSRRSTSMLKHHIARRILSKESIGTFNVVHSNWYARLIERTVCVISRAMSGCPFTGFVRCYLRLPSYCCPLSPHISRSPSRRAMSALVQPPIRVCAPSDLTSSIIHFEPTRCHAMGAWCIHLFPSSAASSSRIGPPAPGQPHSSTMPVWRRNSPFTQ
jgi:hypothetical protein